MTDHDALLRAASRAYRKGEHTPALLLADHKAERSLPGRELLKAYHAAQTERGEPTTHLIDRTIYIGRDYSSVSDPSGTLSIDVNRSTAGHPILDVWHLPEDPKAMFALRHHVRVHSVDHLRALVADLPKPMRAEIARRVRAGGFRLPFAGPVKLARLTAKPRPTRTPGVYDLHDAAGERVGHVKVAERDGGTHLHLEAGQLGADGRPLHAATPDELNDVLDALREHYPRVARGTYARPARPDALYSRVVKLAAIEPPGAPGQSVLVKVPVPKPVGGGASDTPEPERPIKPTTPATPAATSPVWILPQ